MKFGILHRAVIWWRNGRLYFGYWLMCLGERISGIEITGMTSSGFTYERGL